MSSLFNGINSLLSFGTSLIDDFFAKKRVRLTNSICLFLFCVGTPYIFIFYQISPVLGLMAIPFVLSFLGCIWLNRLGLHTASKFGLILSTNIVLLFYSSTLGQEAGVQFVFFANATLPFAMISFLITISCFIFLEITNYQFLVRAVVDPAYMRLIYFTTTFITFFVGMMYFKFYSKALGQAESQLIDVNQSLEKSNQSLQTAYNDLKVSYEKQQEMAFQVDYAKLVREVAHEIKNPMHMIRGSAEVMAAQPTDVGKVETFSMMIMSVVDRLNKVLLPMLKYGRLKEALEPVRFKLNDVVSEIGIMSTGSCEKLGITFEVSCNEDYFVVADPIFVGQILINLMSNAQQFTPSGGHIGLCAGNSEGRIFVSVKDTGCGMSLADIERLKTEALTSGIREHNQGIGIQICYRMVNAIGGELEILSEIGKGTEFKVWFN